MRKLTKLDFPIKLDIGCGKHIIEGFIGMDWQDFGQDIVWDMNHGIPLPDNSVSEIHTSHFAEHLTNKELSNFFSEMIRVGINGAPITFITPHSDAQQAYYLCHFSYWNAKVMQGIVEDSPHLQLIEHQKKDYHFIAKLIIKK